MMQSARLALITSMGSAVVAFPVMAESYCVACYNPDAVYRCVIADAREHAAPDPRNQVQCIKQLAKSGGHARCSVERFTSVGCSGPERVISPSTAAVPVTPVPKAASPLGPPPSDAQAENAAADGTAVDQPPKTVEELAKSTVESTKKGLDGVTGTVKSTTEKAGEQIQTVGGSIGQAAKKSWNCLSSFFSDC
jgi:hypothetical protein